jgi:fibronectin-binding autotransporter adhesin
MPRPSLLPIKSAWWVRSLPLILALASAPKLPGATVITGDVTPGLPWSAATEPNIGVTGIGTLTVDGGSQLSSGTATLGVEPGSTGTAMITGAGSGWTSNTTLYIGDSGSGALRVEAGGEVSNTLVYMGYEVGASGTATITGSGSTWTVGHSLFVSRFGSGALTVENGGLVTARTLYASLGDLHGDGTIVATSGAILDADLQFNAAHPAQAVFNFGTGGTLTVTPALGGSLGAGFKGLGSMTISDGVAISSFSGFLGQASGSMGTATITGAGSKWTLSSQLEVGNSGSGQLFVAAGGQVSNTVGLLGDNANSTGVATITGAGSTWTNSSMLYVGNAGNGSLRVEAGGHVSDSNGYLGFNSGSTGMATITGPGSKWTNSSALYIGFNDSGTLGVEADGQVSNSIGYLGYADGSTGTATITGPGSKWINSSALYVGYNGSGELRVEAGAQVSSTTGALGDLHGSTGTATITGAGSTWSNFTLHVGRAGNAALTVENGGHVTSDTLYASLNDLHGNGSIHTAGAVLDADFQFNAAHPGPTVLEFGTGGLLTVTASGGVLGAGHRGIGTLSISEGVTVASSNGYLGYNSGSTGTATITGVGSKWAHSATVYIGRSGNGALRVEAGGQASNSSLGHVTHLGFNPGSTGTATITGAGSTWAISSLLHVGNSGSGVLRIEAGGQVTSFGSRLGANSDSTGAVTITGAGSKWTDHSGIQVGNFGSGSLTITAGGLARVRTLAIDANGGGDSFVNLATGGMLALFGNVDDSLSQFLGLVTGTDAIRYWNTSLASWTPLTAATLGVDYTLQYQGAGDLNGFTLLTVLAPGPAGDFNGDGRVDGADLLAWQRGNSPTPNSSEDLATWRANFGLSAATPATTAIPEPASLTLLAAAAAMLLRRRTRR